MRSGEEEGVETGEEKMGYRLKIEKEGGKGQRRNEREGKKGGEEDRRRGRITVLYLTLPCFRVRLPLKETFQPSLLSEH